MEITSIEKNRKNNRLSVYIDERFAFTISEEDYLSLNLYEKKELTVETVSYIKNTLNFREAKAKAVRYLSLKLHTEQEVWKKLHDDGYEQECIEKVISELKAIGYINNKLYAQKYVFDRSKLKPLSKKMMKRELKVRGISEDIIDEVLDDWKVEDNVVAEGLLKRKFGKYDLDNEKVRKKAYMFLMHRGFSVSTIKEALQSMSSNANPDTDEELYYIEENYDQSVD
ncbi:MAG: regulatory protein RecX [Clostridiaceae bacterium]|nr:regulatory protein RecX [Clostridiaceae bacterium]